MADSDYAISVQSGYVLVENPPGYKVVLSKQKPKLQAIAAVCSEAGCNKVLMRGAKTKVKLSTVDIYRLAEEIAILGLMVAIVEFHDASQDDEEFLQLVASNRGSPVQFFDNEEDAKAWLDV